MGLEWTAIFHPMAGGSSSQFVHVEAINILTASTKTFQEKFLTAGPRNQDWQVGTESSDSLGKGSESQGLKPSAMRLTR